MDKDAYHLIIAGLILLVIVSGWFFWTGGREIGDYRKALEEANTTIESTYSDIDNAQSEAEGADFSQLQSIISDLELPQTVSDPHPASEEDSPGTCWDAHTGAESC